MLVEFAAFIVDDGDFQFVPSLEVADEFDHLRKAFGLGEHEVAKLLPGKPSFLIKNNATEILLESELADLICIKGEMMALVHLLAVKVESAGRKLAGVTIPSVGEKNSAEIKKKSGDGHG
jgi:hypothetical protein